MHRLLVFSVILLMSATSWARNAQVRFVFFDESGSQLSVKQVIHRMTNGKLNHMSSGTFDLDTLKAVALHNSYDDGKGWVTNFTKLDEYPRQGLMIHWNTSQTGYSSFLLDNEGKGFEQSGAYVFNERLALDARRHLRLAFEARPWFQASDSLLEMVANADLCMDELKRASRASMKGMLGQHCLDRIAVAMRAFVFEVGVVSARKHVAPKWGVTIEPNKDMEYREEYAKVDSVASLFDPTHGWIRLAMYGTGIDDWNRLGSISEYAQSKGLKTMGQLFDSHSAAKVPWSTFVRRVQEVLDDPKLSKIDSWEIGNEVNGGWLGSDVAKKIAHASESVRKRNPDKELCVTFFWYSTQDTVETSLFNWIDKHVISKGLESSFNCVGLSVYTAHEPLGFLWDLVTRKLASTFPDKTMMVGETDFVENPYYEGPQDWTREQTQYNYIQMRYAGAFAIPNSFGGVYWWSFEDHLQNDTVMRRALRDLYCLAHSEICKKQESESHFTPYSTISNF